MQKPNLILPFTTATALLSALQHGHELSILAVSENKFDRLPAANNDHSKIEIEPDTFNHNNYHVDAANIEKAYADSHENMVIDILEHQYDSEGFRINSVLIFQSKQDIARLKQGIRDAFVMWGVIGGNVTTQDQARDIGRLSVDFNTPYFSIADEFTVDYGYKKNVELAMTMNPHLASDDTPVLITYQITQEYTSKTDYIEIALPFKQLLDIIA